MPWYMHDYYDHYYYNSLLLIRKTTIFQKYHFIVDENYENHRRAGWHSPYRI